MALATGTRLGPYEIVGPLGAGGMGEVYRARDARLHREVAIKILPDLFASDPDRLARFEREAQVLASLNHPHIAQIYGLEEGPPKGGPHDSVGSGFSRTGEDVASGFSRTVRGLVMELVEGETLADRIVQGPIPVDEAIAIAKQIADALAAAHEQGIIHRDLKPANVRITPAGTVKVLDFGLAKLAESRPAKAGHYDASMSPTLTSPVLATGIGMLLGTAVYMAPEQAKGRVADKRADVWAFGCVLYEMLTGRRAFDGEGVTETLAAVLMKDPDWSALPPGVPSHVHRVLRRCLRKDPRQRLQDLGDARMDLEEPIADAAPAAVSPVVAPSLWRWMPWAIAGVLLLALPVVWWLSRDPEATPPIVKFGITPPAGLRFTDTAGLATLSPDGRALVMALRQGTEPQLFIRAIDQLEAQPIAGADGAAPFFSPDGRFIAYTSRGSLFRIAVGGGTPLRLADHAWGVGTWGSDGTIIFTESYASGLWRVPANGGTPEKLTDPDTAAGELGHWYPQFLPDGRSILFTKFRTPADRSSLAVYSLDTKKTTVVATNGFFGRYAESGHLLYARSSTVMAVGFDPSTLQTVGTAVPVLEGVATTPSDGEAQFSTASDGTLVYLTFSALEPPLQLVSIGPDGTIRSASNTRAVYDGIAVSPDGRRLAFERDDPEGDIWVVDTTRDTFTRLTYTPGSEIHPIWTADGRRVIFSHEEPVFHMYWRSIDGSGEAERLLDSSEDQVATGVTPDGKFLIFSQSSPATRADLWMVPLTGERKPQLLVRSPFEEGEGVVSADGKWLAYNSNETGRHEVYVQSFPDGRARTQVSAGGGTTPRWSRSGSTLYYRDGDKGMAVAVTAGADLSASKPVLRFQAPLNGAFDTAPGDTFFAILRDPTAPPTPATVVLNWSAELRRQVSPQ
jgi:eukaryotic-like serine/threonine-protein kinase